MSLVDLVAKNPTDANIETLWTLVAKDEFLGYLAWENEIQSFDGYKAPHNWGFYVGGTDHLIHWLPRGAEYTFGSDNIDWASNGAVANFCFSNAGCTKLVAEKFLVLADWMEAEDFSQQNQDIAAWLNPFLDSDPRSNFSAGTVDNDRSLYLGIIGDRPQKLRDTVGAKFPDLYP